MTSRTTPVGILVIALAGLIAVGCSAPTNAVFQALLDPAGARCVLAGGRPPPSDAADGSVDATWWPHPDGYAMVLPAGWSGVAVDRADTAGLIDAVDAANAGLGDAHRRRPRRQRRRASAPSLPTRHRRRRGRARAAGAGRSRRRQAQPTPSRTTCAEQISNLPGLDGGLRAARRRAAQRPRACASTTPSIDPDLGELSVRSYLFRFGRQAYLVNFVASDGRRRRGCRGSSTRSPDSLRFGV